VCSRRKFKIDVTQRAYAAYELIKFDHYLKSSSAALLRGLCPFTLFRVLRYHRRLYVRAAAHQD